MKRTNRTGAENAAAPPESNAVVLQVGDVAPDFIAPSTLGEFILGQAVQRGPVVLAFYPADFTPG